MTFYAVNEDYALRALGATPGDTIRIRAASPRLSGRYNYAEWEREMVDTYIRAAAELAWDNDEPEGYHLRIFTPASRYYWAALRRPPTEPAATEPDPAAEPE